MKKEILAVLVVFAFALPHCFAQNDKNFVGTWEGKINAGIEVRVVFHIMQNGTSGILSTLDSPDQAAYGIKCDTSFISRENLTIEIHQFNASFNGRMINDSAIDGNFRQGTETPLVLHRKTGAASPATDEKPAATNYKSVDVTVQQKNATLSGTCFQPLNDNKSVAVLIIAGSGPTDRDGNNPILPGKNNSLLQLADSLTRYGIASLRYDKRGIGKSRMPAGSTEENMTINDIASDAAAMYEWLKTNGYQNIFIAGHSEGSLIGLMIASDTKAKGFISIAGAGRKAGDILKEQVAAQLSPALATEFNKAIDSLEQGFTVKKIDPSLMSLLRPSVQPYIRSWLKQDPQKLIGQLQCPVLILQGTNDLQVKEKDADSLKAARHDAKLVMIKDMNHVLKEVRSTQVNDNMKAYSDPSLPVAHQLVQAIAEFISINVTMKR